jgi:bifunctional non-homologous end joining protein LigD
VLVSWAVPKGPSTDPAVKRMAVRTEDHPLAYADFEGTIPSGQYGAGTVSLWDRGRWAPLGDPHAGLDAGKLSFELHGNKLRGRWELVRMRGQRKETWLLFKRREADKAQPLRRDAPSRSTEAPRVPAGAAKAPLPQRLSPQLAMLAGAPPTHGRWVFENKFDGYRLLARVERGAVRLFTRNGNDWTAKLPALADGIAALGWRSAWLDGEIVVAGRSGAGAGDFNALQNAFDLSRTQAIDYFVFDLPYFDGHDLRELPLSERR